MIDGNSDLRRPKFGANIPHFNAPPSVRWATVIISAIEEGPVIISVAEATNSIPYTREWFH